jgi:hypothetical protein
LCLSSESSSYQADALRIGTPLGIDYYKNGHFFQVSGLLRGTGGRGRGHCDRRQEGAERRSGADRAFDISRSQQSFEQGYDRDEKQNSAGDEEQPIELLVRDASPAAGAEPRRFQIPAAAMSAKDHWFDLKFRLSEDGRFFLG